MTHHINRAIRALQEVTFDITSLQDDVQLLVDVATGKESHLFHKGTCPDETEGFDARNPSCPICCVIARLEDKPLMPQREMACG